MTSTPDEERSIARYTPQKDSHTTVRGVAQMPTNSQESGIDIDDEPELSDEEKVALKRVAESDLPVAPYAKKILEEASG